MSDYRPLDRRFLAERPVRMEKVELEAGDLCVKAMRAYDYLQLRERAQRPAQDPRGGVDEGEALLWQVLLSCYVDDRPEAPRCFNADDAEDIGLIYSLPTEDFLKILGAINRVNGRDAEEREIRRDFTRARQGAATLPSEPSASTA